MICRPRLVERERCTNFLQEKQVEPSGRRSTCAGLGVTNKQKLYTSGLNRGKEMMQNVENLTLLVLFRNKKVATY